MRTTPPTPQSRARPLWTRREALILTAVVSVAVVAVIAIAMIIILIKRPAGITGGREIGLGGPWGRARKAGTQPGVEPAPE